MCDGPMIRLAIVEVSTILLIGGAWHPLSQLEPGATGNPH